MAISIKSMGLSYHSYQLYDVNFFDDTVTTLVTHTPCIVDTWISDIESLHKHRLHRLVVGLDVEWRPNTSRRSSNPVATLQLCVGRNCLIFQLIYAEEIPQSLEDFLANEDYTFVGVGIEGDSNKLYDDYGLEVVRTVDLRDLAAEAYGHRRKRNGGLKTLAGVVLGKDLKKPKWVTLSDWEADWLSLDQIQYACVDAFASFKIGRVLKAADFS